MEIKNKILVICLFAPIAIFAQNIIVFEDDFHSNKNGWQTISSEEFTVDISNNALHFKKANRNNVNNGCLWYKKEISNFQTGNDFSISFNASVHSSEDVRNSFDLQWGSTQSSVGINTTTLYQLDFDLTKVRLTKFEKWHGWTYYKWSEKFGTATDSAFTIERGKFYNYEIQHKALVVQVYINKILVYSIPAEKLYGHQIGVQQCLRTDWSMTNLCIKQHSKWYEPKFSYFPTPKQITTQNMLYSFTSNK